VIGACNADAPPQPVSRTAMAVDTAPTVHIEADVRVLADSMMVITKREYEKLKAAAGELTRIDTIIDVPASGRRLRRTLSPDGTIRVHPVLVGDSAGEQQRATSNPPRPIVERGFVGSNPAARDSVRAAYWDFQVETPAQWIPGTGAPQYPAMLKSAGVTGSVLATFVVDTDGRAVVSSLKLLRSSQELFSVAVRNALPQMRFRPAEVAGQKVKQVIQQEFTFTIDR
jgi:TonB family protein